VETRSYRNDLRQLPFNTFNEEFEKQLPQHQNYTAAFEATEEVVGRYYSSYDSFRKSREQNLKRRRR
jgi:hypothetical protein